jgi:membrane protein YqaA with SNARE-associated domain
MSETLPTAEKPEASSFWAGRLFRILVLALVGAISAAIFAFRDQFAQLAAIGYPGIFLVSLLSSATIILPAPSLALVFAMGAALNPVFVGLAAGAGEALGELTGYAAGYGGRAVVESQRAYDVLEEWMRKRGGITIFLLSVIPNPIFDVAGIVAGTLGYPVWRFLLFTWLGKTIKTTAVAFAGAQSITLIEQWLS